MGIYYISMGKGVILSVDVLEERFGGFMLTDEVISSHQGDAWTIFDHLIKMQLGPRYSLVFLGHDAFVSRGGKMDVLSGAFGVENQKQMDSIIEWKSQKPKGSKVDFVGYELCFVGLHDEIESIGGEFEYKVSTSELLYGLPALLPGILKLYSFLEAEKCAELAKFFPEYVPSIWTFADDCHCCT